MINIRIVPLTARNIARYFHLGSDTISARIAAYGFFPHAPYWQILLRCQLRSQTEGCLAEITSNGSTAGFIKTTTSMSQLELDWIFVRPSYQGRGLGRAAMHFVESHARRQNLSRITLSVDVDNARALRLYEEFGYVRLPEEQRYHWCYTASRNQMVRWLSTRLIASTLIHVRWRRVTMNDETIEATLLPNAKARIGSVSRPTPRALQALCESLWVKRLIFSTSAAVDPHNQIAALGKTVRMEKSLSA